jgi:hypothetical protein
MKYATLNIPKATRAGVASLEPLDRGVFEVPSQCLYSDARLPLFSHSQNPLKTLFQPVSIMMISSDTAEIIRRKKSQYCRFADSNQWERFKDISLPDATFVFVDPTDTVINTNGVDYQFASRESFVAFFSQVFRNLQTIHMVDPGDLEQTNADEVKAVWSVIYHAGPKGLAQGAHEVGGGHYYEVWVRKGDDWFMKSLRMQRLYHKVLSS